MGNWEQWAVADSGGLTPNNTDVPLLSVSVTVKKCDCNLLVKIKVLNFKTKFSGHFFKIQ